MNTRTKITPNTFTVGPDDRFVEVRVTFPESGLTQPRVRAKRFPEGFTLEKVKRSLYRIWWEGPLTEKTRVSLGVENKVEVQGYPITLIPRPAEPVTADEVLQFPSETAESEEVAGG